MFQDIRLHGQINDEVEYFATIAGHDISNRYFHETGTEEGRPFVRFFSSGNEFKITSEGISYHANGGSFCEYMFGVDLPRKDLIKDDVLNRLVMYGAVYSPDADQITFTNDISGAEEFERSFFEGNAVSNYYFFVHSETAAEPRKRQRTVLQAIGKHLKHTPQVGSMNDAALVRDIFLELRDERSILFLFRLVHRYHEEYYATFKEYYSKTRSIDEDAARTLAEMASLYGIDRYQLERIKIDVMYKHPDNKRIVDEYKNILVNCDHKKQVDHVDMAKLKRLRTLSIRNNIPPHLFDTLDELLLKGKKIMEVMEPEYIMETRSIFEGLFLKGHPGGHINMEDMQKLLKAKQKAIEDRNSKFEEILLETCKLTDENATESDDVTQLENLGYIVTYFDRFDNTNAAISQLSFMENVTVTEEKLRSILGNKRAFDEIAPGLFFELLIRNALQNKYITSFGRRKVSTLYSGLLDVEQGNASIRQVAEDISDVITQEKYYNAVHSFMKEKIKKFYSDLSDKESQDEFIGEVWKEMLDEKLITRDVPEEIFRDAALNIRKEAYYLHNFLPVIIAGKNSRLREDFLLNSGLDRFYVEDLEREYFERNGISSALLDRIRKEEEKQASPAV